MDTSANATVRELCQFELQPIQGHRFQPTGFPDLGAAVYQSPTGQDSLLVESPQSIANRLETVCWDEARQDLVPELAGLPYIRVTSRGEFLTSSILEAHRVNSPYILGADDDAVNKELQKTLGTDQAGPVDISRLARWCFRHDPNSVLHGLFLAQKEIAGGRYRMKRLLSGFIEADEVQPVNSGGVKNDRVNPRGDTKAGFGNVPYQRQEFAAKKITAYFNLDLVTMHTYRLGEEGGGPGDQLAHDLLVTLARWKIRRFLETGLRLRTACDFALKSDGAPNLSDLAGLTDQLRGLIDRCTSAGLFASPPARTVDFPRNKILVAKSAAPEGAS